MLYKDIQRSIQFVFLGVKPKIKKQFILNALM